jgi:hypothetical protein
MPSILTRGIPRLVIDAGLEEESPDRSYDVTG